MATKRSVVRVAAILCAVVPLSCSSSEDGAADPSPNGCPSGLVQCGVECIAVASNPAHCGTCFNACADHEVCSRAACASDCAAGLTPCGQACVDLTSDLGHCGGCDMPCDGTCVDGVCAAATGGSGGGPAGVGGTGGATGGTGGANTGGAGGTNTGGTGGGAAGTGGSPTSCPGAGALFAEMTDPQCTDGRYCEALPDIDLDISGWVAQLEQEPPASQGTSVALQMFDAAWPFAADILRNDLSCADEYMGFVGWGWYNNIGLAVHECGHMWDLDWQQGWTYHMSKDYHLPIPNEDYFPRMEIYQDAYTSEIPDAAANSYFEPGEVTSDQGIQTMFDEWAQYVHSVALSYLLCRHLPFEDLKDFDMGYMLHFAWAAPRYFLYAEQQRPGDFADMMADFDVREAMLALWGQTMLYFDAFSAHPEWAPSVTETRYFDAMRHPDLQDMMDRVRKAHGCPGISP